MTADIERCSPADWIDAASRLLTDVWNPSTVEPEYTAAPLEYSPEYLQWQFTHPSDLPPVCLAIAEGSRLTCFVAAIGHRVRIAADETQLYVSSHFVAAPGSHGMNALRVLRAEAEAIAAEDAAVVSYAGPGSVGEQLLRFVATAGLQGRRKGLLPGHLASPRPNAGAAETVSRSTWTAARMEAPGSPATLEVSLHPQSLAHYEQHPWKREFILAREGSRVIASGIAGTVRSVTRNGPETIAALSAIRATEASGLAALIAHTARRFETKVVSLPVCQHLAAEILKGAGARRIHAAFAWHLYAKPGNRASEAENTALEIV